MHNDKTETLQRPLIRRAHHERVTEPDPLWLAPTVVSPGPLRPPSAQLAALERARASRGLTPSGLDHPRGQWWSMGVLPTALLDVVAVALAFLTGSMVFLVLGVVLAAAVVVEVAVITNDPLRLTAAQRREASRLRLWSGQAWAERADSPERALLAQAQRAVQTITSTSWWWHDDATPVRFQIDFSAELDDIEAQALRLAGMADDPLRAQLRVPLEHRVQALLALAEQVRHRTSLPAIAEPDVAAIIGGVKDEDGADRIAAITAGLRELDR